MSDQLVAAAAMYTTQSKRKKRISMSSAEFEPAIPEIEGPQTNDIDRTATWIGLFSPHRYVNRLSINQSINQSIVRYRNPKLVNLYCKMY